jgi:DNA-binding CsgD family transcriptional regulator
VAARLFVSQHTVCTRLRHVFEKLKLNSRVELASIAARHGSPAYSHHTNM